MNLRIVKIKKSMRIIIKKIFLMKYHIVYTDRKSQNIMASVCPEQTVAGKEKNDG